MTRLVSFIFEQRPGLGLVEGDDVIPLWDTSQDCGDVGLARTLATYDVSALISRANRSIRLPMDRLTWRPPLDDTSKCICVGLNFRDHAAEAKMAIPTRPSLFLRLPSSFVGHEQSVLAPACSQEFDYEGELVLIIGRAGRHIPARDAIAHVLGYTIMAENSVRDWQKHSTQATAGKNFFKSGAIGPWVTIDEFEAASNFQIITRLNGTIVQNGNTDQFIFSASDIIAYVSTFTELVPGDMIALGTPSGVGMGRTPPLWLKPDDLLEVEIPGIGILRNRVARDDGMPITGLAA